MTKLEILEEIFQPKSFDCQTSREDLEMAIRLNPNLAYIEEAMERYVEQEKIKLKRHLEENIYYDYDY